MTTTTMNTTSMTAPTTAPTNTAPTGTRTVHLAVYDTLADWEVGYATAHINIPDWQRHPGTWRVRTVGETAGPITTMGGMQITPDLTLDQLAAEDSAMLILPGAGTWLSGGNLAFTDAARTFLGSSVPVAAICGATVGLAAAGVLDDHDHTSNAAEAISWTGYAGADRYRDEPAVTDGDLITASGTAPVEFAREMFARLGLYEPHVLSAWYKLYGLHDPAGYAELMAAAS